MIELHIRSVNEKEKEELKRLLTKELHFERSFQGHPTLPYFARPNMHPNMPNMAIYAYLCAYLGILRSLSFNFSFFQVRKVDELETLA